MKKIFAGLLGVAALVFFAPMFAAFEAHVINVTAKIENALSVSTDLLDFGTVFPQEHLNLPVRVALSDSFMAEDRVDDVEYFIRQKPKCGVTTDNGETLVGETWTGHVVVDESEQGYHIDCDADRPDGVQEGPDYLLPSLCEYISKEDDQTPDNDGSLASFHKPWTIGENGLIDWNDTPGYLAKSANDTEDNWTIDLAVPCFGNHCAQDWHDFVTGINPTVTDPDEYTQPIENEHKIFGCNLWFEVGGISLPGGGVGCAGKADVMLVLDRSGSIGGDLQTLKDAALGFVTALNPEMDGVHIGQSSFSTSGSLDTHLTSDETMINAAINALDSDGSTNLAEGITLATGELANPGDMHDRPDGESPDFMVIITDGQPNTPGGEAAAQAAGIAAATAAKAAGIEIFVVGVGDGINDTTAAYLRDNIASGADHYYSAADFDDLETVLDAIANCENGDGMGGEGDPPPQDPVEETLLDESFGTDGDPATVPGWNKHEIGTTRVNPTMSGEDTVSPDGGRFVKIAEDQNPNDGVDGWICRQVDTTGYENLELSYYWRGDADAGGPERGRVQYFTGGTCAAPTGGPMELEAHDLTDDTAWSSHTETLPDALENTTFLLRFYNDSNANSEYFRVDGIELTGFAI